MGTSWSSLPDGRLAQLECAGVEVGLKKPERTGGRWMDGFWGFVYRYESHGCRLLVIRAWVSVPLPREKAKREAMSEVAIRIANRVPLGLRERGEGHEILAGDHDSSLLGDLVDCRLSEAAADLRRAGRQAPRPIVGTSREKHLAVVALERDHCPWHQDQLVAHCLA